MQSNDDELIGLIRRLEKKINNDQQTRSKHVSNYTHLYFAISTCSAFI